MRLRPLALATVLACVGCSRGAAIGQGGRPLEEGAPELATATDERGWRVECEKFCNVDARAATLDGLCGDLDEHARTLLGPKASCSPRQPIALDTGVALAIEAVAVLDVEDGLGGRWALLAVDTARGWVFARELGRVTKAPQQYIGVTGVAPVDVAGLEPAGVAVHVALGRDGIRSERLFVCGLLGQGGVSCPLTAVVGRAPEEAAAGTPVAAAGLGAALSEPRHDAFHLDIEITAQGFVARPSSGTVPRAIAPILGEHAWAEAR